MTAIVAILGALLGVGVMLVVAGWRGDIPPRRVRPAWSPGMLSVAASLTAGAVMGGVTGWPVAALFAMAAAPLLPRWIRARGHGQVAVERLEGLAAWTEMLRDTLQAAAGIEGAISATARVAPVAVRADVQALAARLHRQQVGDTLGDALRDFAVAINHHMGDRVVNTLIAASERQGGGVTEQLTVLATHTRELLAFYREIDTDRVELRATIRLVVAVTVVFTVVLTAADAGYFAPFGTRTGQLVLLIGPGGLFGLGFGLMALLSRLPDSPRFLRTASRRAAP
jgi:Flp pilus assembly protein TadB